MSPEYAQNSGINQLEARDRVQETASVYLAKSLR